MKKFKNFFIAILLLSVLSLSIVLCACLPNDNDNKNTDKNEQQSGEASGNVKDDEIVEPYSLALTQFYTKENNPYITDYFDDESKLNLTAKINSVEELKTFCREKQLQVYDQTTKTTTTDPVSKKLNTYDEDFFKNRSIVLVFRFKETDTYYGQCLVDIKENEMDINLISTNGSATTNTRTQVRILEISKNVAQNVTQINVQESISEIDQQIDVKIYEDDRLYKKDNAQTSFLINSIEELNDLCDEETSLYFQKNHLTMQDVYPPEFLTDENFIKAFDELFNNRNKKMISILKQYDEEFFQDNSIVVLFRFRSSIGYFYRFDGYQIDGNELSVDLVRKLPSELVSYPAAVTNCVYIMEINKEKVANVTQINVNEYVE